MKLPKTVTIPYIVYLLPPLLFGIMAGTFFETIIFTLIYGIISMFSGELNWK